MRNTPSSVHSFKSELYERLLKEELSNFTKEEILKELERLLNRIDSDNASAYGLRY